MKTKYKLSGAMVAIGLLVGTFGGALAGAGNAGANTLGNLGLPLGLSTTTTMAYSTSVTAGVESLTMTATVTMELLKGALITPSGPVQFEATEYPRGGGENYYLTQSVPLTRCLLGLPGVLGLWQETCSASYTLPLTYGTCGPTGFGVSYTGSSDLLADPSSSPVVYLPANADGCHLS